MAKFLNFCSKNFTSKVTSSTLPPLRFSTILNISNIHPPLFIKHQKCTRNLHTSSTNSYIPPFNEEEAKLIHQMAKQNERKQFRRVLKAALLSAFLMYGVFELQDVNSFVYKLGSWWMVRWLDAEICHEIVMWMARYNLLPKDINKDDFALQSNVGGLMFPNPVGLAAGFDKDARAPLQLIQMGFGFVEVGTITPKPQDGNPKPRVFRLVEDAAIINRFGFNSQGADAAENRLKEISINRRRSSLTSRNPIGVNIGKNKCTFDASEDIRFGINKLGRYADYLVINVSSPNTANLRDLQRKEELRNIVEVAQNELNALPDEITTVEMQGGEKVETQVEEALPNIRGRRPLLFVKIAPDLTYDEKRDIAEVALEKRIDGLIICNTTISRPPDLLSKHKEETGGLSGAPIKQVSTECVSDMYQLTNGRIPIIACGGIECGADALEKIEAGASLVQIYTSLIYNGPAVVRRIKDELSYLFYKKGYYNMEAAIGSRFKTKKRRVKPPKFD